MRPWTAVLTLLTWFTALYTVMHVFFWHAAFLKQTVASVADSVSIILPLLASMIFY
jgi:hypothetical protein